ncbi:MAG: glycosyltransferase family 4 protein [Rhodoplanes sp.]
MDQRALEAIEVIVPNLHWRYSGVTATNRMIAPRLAERVRAAWLGRHAPDGIAQMSFGDLLTLRRPRPGGQRVIWHARRNDEMMVGLLLKKLGWPLALVFTSAAQRRHTSLTRRLIAAMDAVISPTEAAASFLDRAAVIVPHGVDTELYRPPADRMAAFAATGLPGCCAIGLFGRVRPQKGTDVFIKAMCRLLPRYPDFTAIVIGRVSAEHRAFAADLERRAAAAGIGDRVHFLGELPIEEVPPWYQAITIYVFASRNEGFGLTLIEAMAAGCALVAARAGAADKVVTDGENGLLVPPGDVDALVSALEPLMRDPPRAAALGRRARERVLAAFSIAAEADRIVALYHTLWQAMAARPR